MRYPKRKEVLKFTDVGEMAKPGIQGKYKKVKWTMKTLSRRGRDRHPRGFVKKVFMERGGKIQEGAGQGVGRRDIGLERACDQNVAKDSKKQE